jgi:hypothetical protein
MVNRQRGMRRIEEGIRLNRMSWEGDYGYVKQGLLALLQMLSRFGDAGVRGKSREAGHLGNSVYCRIVSGL